MRLSQKITWIPYELMRKIKNKKRNFIKLDFGKIGLKRKFKFYLPKDDEGLSSQLISFGFREPLNLRYSYKFVSKSDKVLDIGSNIGLFPLLSENAKEIICVEPLKEAIPTLEKNIKENGLSNKTKIINAAVGKKGKLIIEVDKKLNLSRIINEKSDNSYEIKSFELKDLVRKYKSNYLRMDVEGYEYEILLNKVPKRIKKISIEFHTGLLGRKKTNDLLSYFKKEKFKASYFIEDLPLRLYPFYSILRKFGLVNLFSYVKKDESINGVLESIDKGRKVKYLFLER